MANPAAEARGCVLLGIPAATAVFALSIVYLVGAALDREPKEPPSFLGGAVFAGLSFTIILVAIHAHRRDGHRDFLAGGVPYLIVAGLLLAGFAIALFFVV